MTSLCLRYVLVILYTLCGCVKHGDALAGKGSALLIVS